MDRQPIVAGQFYPGVASALKDQVQGYMTSEEKSGRKTILAMVPHAGYPYSGPVAGKVVAEADLADTVIMFGPNHSGRGRALAVWPEGSWKTPLGKTRVDSRLADALIEADNRLVRDYEAHLYEHSLEVVVPFLAVRNPEVSIVPVSVGERRPEVLLSVAGNIAAALEDWPEPVSIVVSSDMSHYVAHKEAEKRDSMALEAIRKLDPEGLFDVVRRQGITMCGVLPMTLGLATAVKLGAQRAEVAAYSTSGEASGDYDRVVGYAGVLVD
jgi:hypothetical protein